MDKLEKLVVKQLEYAVQNNQKRTLHVFTEFAHRYKELEVLLKP